MSDGAILAIDQGTSATKAIVVDPVDGVIAWAGERFVRGTFPAAAGDRDPTSCSTRFWPPADARSPTPGDRYPR